MPKMRSTVSAMPDAGVSSKVPSGASATGIVGPAMSFALGLAQKVEVGIGEAVTQAGMAAEPVRVERRAHRLGVQAEFSGHRADLLMLGMKQMADVGNC